MNKKEEICNKCKGKGEYQVMSFDKDNGKWVICDKCFGMGKIYK